MVETSDEGCKIVQDRLDTSFRCEAAEQESKNGRSNIGNGVGMQPAEENVAVPKVTNLSGVLESLMRYWVTSIELIFHRSFFFILASSWSLHLSCRG